MYSVPFASSVVTARSAVEEPVLVAVGLERIGAVVSGVLVTAGTYSVRLG